MKRQAQGPAPPIGALSPITATALPPLFSGKRRPLIVALVFTALGLATCSAAIALLMAWLLAGGRDNFALPLSGLTATILGIGFLQVLERVLAEKLGQDYVQQIREKLIRESLTPGSQTSLGITIARTTNDLSSIRNWIVLGFAPVIAGVPVIAALGAALWLLSPPLTAAGMVPLCLLGVVLFLLRHPALARAQEVRRRRGRLAARVADLVSAAASVHAAGGTRREVRRVRSLGDQLAAAAIRQARTAGYLRASSAVAASASVAAFAGAGAWLNADTAVIAAGLTAIGMMSAPVAETGRIIEYRQKFLAARTIIAPLMVTATARQHHPQKQSTAIATTGTPRSNLDQGRIQISGLILRDGTAVEPLHAEAGDRIVIRSQNPEQSPEVCQAILGLLPDVTASVNVNGYDLLTMSPERRRAAIGFASRGAILAPGTISRALRYRRPDLPETATRDLLERVGLTERLAGLEAGALTRLRRGGAPLHRSDLARLQLASALLGDPPLLVLDHIDADLGPHGSDVMGTVLASYPGVAIIASETPDAIPGKCRTWHIDLPHSMTVNEFRDPRPGAAAQ